MAYSILHSTRKYLLCVYILGAIKHTTAWDLHWEGDENTEVSFNTCMETRMYGQTDMEVEIVIYI